MLYICIFSSVVATAIMILIREQTPNDDDGAGDMRCSSRLPLAHEEQQGRDDLLSSDLRYAIMQQDG